MTLHTDRALVLSRHAFGESSLVVHVLTPGSGRVNVLAKGAYRPTSRYFAVLDRFDTLELEWSAAPRQELATLRRGDVLVRRAPIAGAGPDGAEAIVALCIRGGTAPAEEAGIGLGDQGDGPEGSQADGVVLGLGELGHTATMPSRPARVVRYAPGHAIWRRWRRRR